MEELLPADKCPLVGTLLVEVISPLLATDMLGVGMAISGMVPVTFSPFAYAVLPMSMSPAVAVASIVSGPVVMSRILSAKSLAFIGAALPSLFLIALAMAVRFSDCTLIAHRPFRLYVCYQPQVESFMIATNQSPQLWCRRLLGRPLSAHV